MAVEVGILAIGFLFIGLSLNYINVLLDNQFIFLFSVDHNDTDRHDDSTAEDRQAHGCHENDELICEVESVGDFIDDLGDIDFVVFVFAHVGFELGQLTLFFFLLFSFLAFGFLAGNLLIEEIFFLLHPSNVSFVLLLQPLGLELLGFGFLPESLLLS